MEKSNFLTISTVLSPYHTLSEKTVWGMFNSANNIFPWQIEVGRKVDWVNNTIGTQRLEALENIKSKYIYCLDSDDELLIQFPIESMVKRDVDFFLFNSLMANNEQRKLLNSKFPFTNSAVQRVVFKTKFLKRILIELQKTSIIREDVFMMWKAFEYGACFKYFNKFICRKHGRRCSDDKLFSKIHEREKPFWKDVFNDEFIKNSNKRIMENGIL